MKGGVATYTGRHVPVFDLRPEHVDIEDIAHALSQICRFNGHTRSFYSVAEHSVRVSQRVPEAMQAAALLHDAAEAYIGDIVRPIKRATWLESGEAEMRRVEMVERQVVQAIYAAFGVPIIYHFAPEVRTADDRMLQTEGMALVPGWRKEWANNVEPYEVLPLGQRPTDAKRWFLQCWDKYSGKS